MKHIFSLLLIGFIHAFSLSAQPSEAVWINKLTAPNADAIPEPVDFFVAKDGYANLLIVAYSTTTFNDSLTWDVDPDFPELLWNKYDPAGNLVATKRIKAAAQAEDVYGRITGDAQGNTYMMVTYDDEVDLGDGFVLPAPDCANCSPLFFAKFDPQGHLVWVKTFELLPSESLKASGLASDAQGNIYATLLNNSDGFAYEGLDVSLGILDDNLLVHFDSAGALVWYKTIPFNAYLQNVETNGNEVFIAGSFGDNLDLGNGVTVQAPNFGTSYFFARYQPDGSPIDAAVLSSSDYMDLLDIDADTQGRLYISVDFSDELSWKGSPILNSTTTYTAAMLVWDDSSIDVPLLAPYSDDSYPFTAITLGADGRYYAAGYMTDQALVIDNNLLTLEDCADPVVVEGQLGTAPKAINIGGAGCEGVINIYYANAIDLDADDNLYLSGVFVEGGTLSGNTLSGSGAFVAKLNATTSVRNPVAQPIGLVLSPNPNAGYFTLQLGHTPNEGTIQVYDVSGQLVKNIPNIKAAQVPLDLDLPNGQYVVQFTDGQQTGVAKMTVLR